MLLLLLACTTSNAASGEARPGSSTTSPATETPSSSPERSGHVVVNEVMPDNDSTWADEQGGRSDWVELLNTTDAPIPWSSIVLADDGSGVWVGGAGDLAPGELALLDSATLGFGLDADGDSLSVLVDNTLSDEVHWEDLPPDVSLARIDELVSPTAWPTPGAPNGEVSPTLDAADATVFVSDRVHTIDIEVTDDQYELLAKGTGFIGTFIDYEEVEAHITIDGIPYPSVGLRRKGSASTDALAGKPPFKVDLNEFVPGTRFRTLKAFNLHNGKVMDPTLIHEHLSYSLARASGLAAPRVGWAVVTLNGLDYGIYALVETHDDVFVERFFPGAGEQGVVLEPNESTDGSWLAAGDFGGPQETWDFEEGQVPVDPDMIAAVEAIDQIVRGPASDAAMAELFTHADRDAFLTYLAWEDVVGHHDGYHVPNNWRLFVHPETHLVHLLPSGADWTWDQPADPWFWGGKLGSFCLDNDACTVAMAEKMVEVADTTDAMDLLGDYDRIFAGLESLIRSQPRGHHSDNAITRAHQRTRQTLQSFPDTARTEACREKGVCP